MLTITQAEREMEKRKNQTGIVPMDKLTTPITIIGAG
jgi:hypothetical protein